LRRERALSVPNIRSGDFRLYLTGRISRNDALSYATSSSDLKLKMEGLTGLIDKNQSGKEESPKEFKEEEFIALKR